MSACLAPAHPRKLPVMPEIVPVVPAAIAPSPAAAISPTEVRPFSQQRDVRRTILSVLELDLGNSRANLAQPLGDARYRRVIFSIHRRSFRLHSRQQRRNSQNTGGKQYGKRLFDSATHGHRQAPSLRMRANYHRAYISSTSFM